MKGTSFLWKFGFVAVLVLLCAISLLGKGLPLGQDIAGGYSMVFEMKDLGDRDPKTTVRRVIEILKNRIDPSGLASLEWTPLKNGRFEVRMPAAGKNSESYRNAFLSARKELLATNITRSNLRQLLELPADQRAAKTNELTGGDEAQNQRVATVLVKMQALLDAKLAVDAIDKKSKAATSDAAIAELQTQLDAAKNTVAMTGIAYKQAADAVEDGNVRVRELQATLALLDEVRQQTTDNARLAAKENFDIRLNALKRKYPTRADQLVKVADAYRIWSSVRRPLESPGDLKRLIRQTGVLNFRIAPLNPQSYLQANPEAKTPPVSEADIQLYVKSLETEGPSALITEEAPYAWYPLRGEEDSYDSMITQDYAGKRYILLSNKDGQKMVQDMGQRKWELASARVGNDQVGSPAVDFTFDDAGASYFSRLTKNNIGQLMAILLDDEVYSAPRINSMISSHGQITGKFSIQEVRDLVRTLEAGSLPGKVSQDPVSESNYGAAIGEENMKKGFRAGIYGLIAVAAFMLIYYLFCGAVANVALALNIIFVLGAMSMFNAVLTLPGIAGIILTIGMAVDANVLIFERLREEQAKGLGVKQAITNAYDRAFTAIFDANATTMLICLILYFVLGLVGMEEVRGFAVTLGLGVAFSMLTALVITRWIFQVMLQAKLITKPMKLLQLIPKTNINWIGKRYVFWTISIVMVVAGLSALISQGSDVLGIEFSSGTQATVKFRDGAELDGQPLNDDVVRAVFAKAATQIAKETGNDKLTGARVTTVINEEETAAGVPQTSYIINTTETDAKLLRRVATDAFGTTLERRLPCSFDFATGQLIQGMNVQLSGNPATWITTDLWTRAAGGFGQDIEDFEGGVLFVTENVSPAITVEELSKRIRDMRLQQDFDRQSVNPYRVLGLKQAGNDTFSSFVVLVRPAESDSLKTDAGRRAFASEETRLLTAAMETEDAMVLTSFDASIAEQTAQLAIVVVVLSWLSIIAYLWLRFGSVQWGFAAVICLIHDVIIVVGLVALSGWVYGKFGTVAGISAFKIDLPMVAALLTVIGYSVNDTIVVFDRIRENRGKLKVVTAQAINESINQTLPRTLLTSMTTLIVVLVMYIWGGPGIRAFSYALLMGIIFGTYSSVAVASPLLLGFKQAVITRVSKDEEPDHDADLKGE